MSDRTPEKSSRAEATASFIEVVNACQGLAVIFVGVGIFLCLPFVSKDIREEWKFGYQLILGIGATLVRPTSGSKNQVFQRGKFEKIEGGIVTQNNETDPNDSNTY